MGLPAIFLPSLHTTALEKGYSEDSSDDLCTAPQSLNQDPPEVIDWCACALWNLAAHFLREIAKKVENKLFSVMATKLNTFYINNSEGLAPGKYIWQGK